MLCGFHSTQVRAFAYLPHLPACLPLTACSVADPRPFLLRLLLLSLAFTGGFLECTLKHTTKEEQAHHVEGETLVDSGGRMSSAFQVFD